jgi:hypothetical protein
MRVTLWTAALVLVAMPALAADGWWTRQADLELASLTGTLAASDLGGSPEFGETVAVSSGSGGSFGKALPMLMSAVLPGAGQVYLGLKQDRRSALVWGAGFLAADIFSWTQVVHNNERGLEKKDEYYAFADEHWNEEKLAAAYNSGYPPGGPYDYVANLGTEYFHFLDADQSPIGGYTEIPLWVSQEADRREYYENLGKWDQFVFGWDDFRDPREFLTGVNPNQPESPWLDDPRTSVNRETYRQMRRDSNDYFSKRDRFVYLSLGLRVVSVLHVAYLEGLLFGGDGGANDLQVAGQPVQFIAQPVGLRAGVVGATVAF